MQFLSFELAMGKVKTYEKKTTPPKKNNKKPITLLMQNACNIRSVGLMYTA